MKKGICRVLATLGVWLAALSAVSSPLRALDPQKAISQYLHKKWTTDDGIAQQVLSIGQRADGYIWIGTVEGLYSFDGQKFSLYDPPPATGYVTGYPIRDIITMPDNSIWFSTRGMGIFHMKDKTVERIDIPQGLSSTNIFCLQLEPGGTLWIGTNNQGLDRWQDGKVTTLTTRQGLTSNAISALLFDPKENLWVGTPTGLTRISKGEIHSFLKRDGLLSENITCLSRDERGQIWVGTDHGISLYDGKRFTPWPQNSLLTSTFITQVLEDRDGNIWIGTRGGVNRLAAGRLTSFTVKDNLSNNYIRSLFQDQDGGIWIGTGGGLDLLKESKMTAFSKRENLSSDYTTAIFEDSSGNLWIANGERGIDVLSRNGAIKNYSTATGLTHNNISAVWEAPDKTIWIGTWGAGICFIRDGACHSNLTTATGLSSNFINAIVGDRDGSVWVGTENGGVNRIRKGQITVFSARDGLIGSNVLCIHPDRRGQVWIGTEDGGLSRYSDGRFVHFGPDQGIPDLTITSIYEDEDGSIWISTRDSGLILMRPGKTQIFSKANGLYHNTIYHILEDHRKNLWLSTPKGIFSVSKIDLESAFSGKIANIPCTVYGKAEGMRNIQCLSHSQNTGLKSRDGRLWFPTMEGVVMIDPAHIQLNFRPPEVSIEQFLADGLRFPVDQPIRVSAGRRNFEFHYTALLLTAPEKALFRYKLEGFDSDWVDARSRREAYYTVIPPGSYTFRVIACNSDGIWNATGASLSFRLAPYFTQTGWFIMLLVAVLLCGGFSLYTFRVRSLKHQQRHLANLVQKQTQQLQAEKDKLVRVNQELQKANDTRNEFLGFVAHDLKNTLQSIMGFAEMNLTQAEAGTALNQRCCKILNSAERMLNLIEDLLHSSMIENGQVPVKLAPLDVSRLAEKITQSFQPQSLQKGQSLILSAVPGLRIMGDEQMIRRVYDNLVSNAIKFSPTGRTIWATLAKTEGAVRFSVRDQGPGLSEEDRKRVFGRFQRLSAQPTGGESSTGLGLFIVKQLVDLHGGKIWVESEKGIGSTFIVDLPMSDE